MYFNGLWKIICLQTFINLHIHTLRKSPLQKNKEPPQQNKEPL